MAKAFAMHLRDKVITDRNGKKTKIEIATIVQNDPRAVSHCEKSTRMESSRRRLASCDGQKDRSRSATGVDSEICRGNPVIERRYFSGTLKSRPISY
jgi:hypothetical protein